MNDKYADWARATPLAQSAFIVLYVEIRKTRVIPGTSMCAHVRVKGWTHNATAHRVFCHFLSPFGFFQNQKLIVKLLDFDCKNTSESIGCIQQEGKVEKQFEKRPSSTGVQTYLKKESRTHLGAGSTIKSYRNIN